MASPFRITGDDAADQLLADDPLALLIGLLLDQQVPMEWAFKGPATLNQRLGALDPAVIASMDPDKFAEICSAKPAIHRFPSSMAKRIQALCQVIVDEYDGDARALWRDVDATELITRTKALPGFGPEKAKILVAILAKRFDVRPDGWEKVAAPFSDAAPRSAADVADAETLLKVREFKRQQKAKGKGKAD
jgi:uncharacterized HhH-GPD family protein